MANAPAYERSTSATTLAELPAPVREAIATHAEQRQLTVGIDAPAWVTHSRQLPQKRGFFGRRLVPNDPDAEHLTVAVIGARDLLVVTHGEQRGTHVLSARLEDLDVARLGEQYAGMGLDVPDDGVSVTGFATSGAEGSSRGSFYVGLGPPAGDAAEAALRDAVRAAKAV